MLGDQLKTYICLRTLPTALNIEAAKKIILEYIVSHPGNAMGQLISGSDLIKHVSDHKDILLPSGPAQADYESIDNYLSDVRAKLVARETILSLHAGGTLIAYGAHLAGSGTVEKHRMMLGDSHRQEPYEIEMPSIHMYYRLAAHYREGQAYRLSSGNVYLSYLAQENLPSRVKRCLRECVDAYRAGLYLSATMSVGAASESK